MTARKLAGGLSIALFAAMVGVAILVGVEPIENVRASVVGFVVESLLAVALAVSLHAAID